MSSNVYNYIQHPHLLNKIQELWIGRFQQQFIDKYPHYSTENEYAKPNRVVLTQHAIQSDRKYGLNLQPTFQWRRQRSDGYYHVEFRAMTEFKVAFRNEHETLNFDGEKGMKEYITDLHKFFTSACTSDTPREDTVA